ncbi:hypothetical protein BGZ83_001949 [Gryganskiella cystojenkinii]|nr:hypothetical protein BGZ83_001949 [Gryganskiella cystojenkinii]
MAMMFTAQSLEWIQSLGPMVWLAWDSFLPGALFLTMNIDPDLLDGDHHPEAMIPLPSSSSKTASSRSSRSSSNSSNKKVTFDEQVMILGRSAALAQQIQQQQQHADRSYSVMIDPTQPLVESPTRTEFFDKHSILSMMRQEEAAYQQQHYYNTNKGYRSTGTNSTVSNASSDNMSLSDCGGSPASSRSNSCRSSICSIDSNESRETKKSTSSRIAALFHPHRHASTASRPSSPVGSSRHIHGSTLGDFAFNTQQKVSATALVPNTAAFADSLPSVIPTHHKHPLMHKIMHPHQHKRELLGQQQLQQQQQIGTPRSSQEEVWSLTDYEPRHKTKSKTLGERLGLKKNKKAL